jgi:hypothetical protein
MFHPFRPAGDLRFSGFGHTVEPRKPIKKARASSDLRDTRCRPDFLGIADFRPLSGFQNGKLQRHVGLPVVTSTDLHILFEEESIAKRHGRVRGAGSLSQVDKVTIVTQPGRL